MIKIPEIVENIIKTRPFLEEALSKDLINLSSLSRQIKPEIEAKLNKPINMGAIVMALKRMQPSINININEQINKVIENFGDITVRSNLANYTFKNSDTLIEKQSKLLNIIENKQEVFYTLSYGVYETTFIISNIIEEQVEEIFKEEQLLSKTIQLASITIRLPIENTEIAGIYYFIFKKIAWEGITILEIVSTSNEFTVVVHDKDVDSVFSLLKNIKHI